jgi:hypothetical protein
MQVVSANYGSDTVVGSQVDEVHKVPICALFPLRALGAIGGAGTIGALDSLGLVGACFPRFVHFVRLHQICVLSALSSNFSTWNPTTQPHGTSKQYLRGCFDWRSIDLLINCGDSANGSGAGTRYNWVVVRAREIEDNDNDNRSWPGSGTAERVPPGGATTGLHFDIGPTAGAEKEPRSGAPIFGRKRNRVHVEGPSITRSESTLVDHAVPPDASAGT